MLLTLSVTETISWGVLYYAFTVFVAPMEAELGWSRPALVGAFSLALLLSGLAGLPVGRWLDRHGPRALMTAGSVAAALLVLAWAAVTDLLAFYLTWAALGLTLAAVLYEPAFWLVATWFRRGRGRALTVLTFIAGFASVIFLPLADWLVRAQGWRGALVTLAIILAAGTILPHALVLRRHPRDLGLGPDGLPAGAPPAGDVPAAPPTAERSVPADVALRSPGFWRLSLAFFLATLAVGALFVHLVPYLIDQGYDPAFAAWMVGLIGLMGLPGRLLFTPLGDVLPRRVVTAFLFALQALALLALLVWRAPAGVLAFAALFGAGFGAITPARAALLAETYGPAHYGRIGGVLAFALTGARALAPVGAGLLAAGLGGYEPVFWALLAGSVVATVAVLPPDRGG
jgi:MFS family permease